MLPQSSAGLLVSTMTTRSPSGTSVSWSGTPRFQRSRTKVASVLGAPRRTASASSPRTSRRNQAQTIALAALSVSGEVWPKTLIVMSRAS